MRALDITTGSVVTDMPEVTVHDVATLFVDNQIGGMPVIDATGKVVGIVGDSDLLHRIENGKGRSKRALWLEILLSAPREPDPCALERTARGQQRSAGRHEPA